MFIIIMLARFHGSGHALFSRVKQLDQGDGTGCALRLGQVPLQLSNAYLKISQLTLQASQPERF
jgi:hypothetical protein